ncbi:hypothetical protein BHYA_0557g00010 [Botrytis hyacinthi]|uniref:Uncharacterized protein n=1 Tax=Botrytis hyacinthi TaxID=278943 RepID=A0A4Z1G7Y1_9HELO|nr:hypothetical protein BHYA_0557g00010 [Botrytis hyacinthi]
MDILDKTIDIHTDQELQQFALALDIQQAIDVDGTIIDQENDVMTSTHTTTETSETTMRTADASQQEQDSRVHLGGGSTLMNLESSHTHKALHSEEALEAEDRISTQERTDQAEEFTRSTPTAQNGHSDQPDSMEYEHTGSATQVIRGEYESDPETHPTDTIDSYTIEEVTSPERLPSSTRTIDQFKEDQISLLPDRALKRQRIMRIEIPRPTLNPDEYQSFDFDQSTPDINTSADHQYLTRQKKRLQDKPSPHNQTLIGTLIANLSKEGDSRIEDFHTTFWPSHPNMDKQEEQHSFVTVHSVIASAIRTKLSPPNASLPSPQGSLSGKMVQTRV